MYFVSHLLDQTWKYRKGDVYPYVLMVKYYNDSTYADGNAILLTCVLCAPHTAPLSFSVGLWNYQSAINKQISFRPLLLSLLLVSWAWLRPGFVQKTQQPLMFSLTTSLSLFIAFLVNWVPFIEELDGQLSSFSGDGSPLVDFCDFSMHLEKPYTADFHSLTHTHTHTHTQLYHRQHFGKNSRHLWSFLYYI